MGAATAYTEANFKNSVASGVTLVDFWAEWCGPCKMIAPAIDELAKEYEGRANVGKVDVDEAGGLAQDYGVSSIPTLIVLKDGAEVKRFVGVTPIAELRKAIEAALS
jgi:thioredoxin 1